MTARGKTTPVVDDFGHVSTPAWAVDRLIEKWTPVGEMFVEPGAGKGAIIKAMSRHYRPKIWHAIEIQQFQRHLFAAGADVVTIVNYLRWSLRQLTADVVLGNPMFSIAIETVTTFQRLSPAAEIVLLLPLNFLASAKRHPILAPHPPDLFVLPDRPSFRANGKTDAQDYGWFRWLPGNTQRGRIVLLDVTPKDQRRKRGIGKAQ